LPTDSRTMTADEALMTGTRRPPCQRGAFSTPQ
jgi:hypothetical protein